MGRGTRGPEHAGAAAGGAPSDLAELVRTIDRHWSAWECSGGGAVAAPWGFLVGVEAPAGRLLHRPLPAHPVHALAGWVAPGHWCVVGVAVRGTAHRWAGDGHDGGAAEAARVIWVCHRNGSSASLLGLTGEPVVVVVSDPATCGSGVSAGNAGDGTHGEGRVPRLLRLTLSPLPPEDLTRPGAPG